MKKVVIGLLVLALLGGTAATAVIYLLQDAPASKNPFADVPKPVIRSERFADYSGANLTGRDLRGLDGALPTVSFDTGTKWPAEDKMPQGFSPGEIMDYGRDLGLGLKALHSRGITGRGVSIAIIDGPILTDHEAVPKNMTYIEVNSEKENGQTLSDRGQAAASIMAGPDGVAPQAHLYYFAVRETGDIYADYAQAMSKVLETQNSLPKDQKIRIVSVSLGVSAYSSDSSDSGLLDWLAAIETAEKSGIIVVYPAFPELAVTGAGCLPTDDRDDPANYRIWSWDKAKMDVSDHLLQAGATTWASGRKELLKMLTDKADLDYLQADAVNTFIYYLEYSKDTQEFTQWLKSMAPDTVTAVAVPTDYITVPSSKGTASYKYYGSGILTLSTHYVAGLMALGLQVSPDADLTQLIDAIRSTSTPMQGGRSLVNPTGFIQSLGPLRP